MKERTLGASFVLAIIAAGLIAVSTPAFQRRFALPAPPTKAEIERGRYLVEEIGKCAECHTPRKADGKLDTAAWMQGAPIWFRPVSQIPNWADRAPALAGLPGLTTEQVEKVLEDGTGPNAQPLRPPMRIYHMAPADARAIAAYLQSLPTDAH